MRHARLACPRPGHARLHARHGMARASVRRLLQTLLHLFECTRLQQIHTSRRPRCPRSSLEMFLLVLLSPLAPPPLLLPLMLLVVLPPLLCRRCRCCRRS